MLNCSRRAVNLTAKAAPLRNHGASRGLFFAPVRALESDLLGRTITMRNRLCLLALLSTLVLPPTLSSLRAQQEKTDDRPRESSIWMKQKLVASQNILAGLTKGDYDSIEKNAQSMLAVSYLEKWVRAGTPGYRKLMQDFESANKSLTVAARERNLDGATIAYVQLTLSCVHCHKIVRDGT
jgi:hypothetical protein